jgi:hypothetical protein
MLTLKGGEPFNPVKASMNTRKASKLMLLLAVLFGKKISGSDQLAYYKISKLFGRQYLIERKKKLL